MRLDVFPSQLMDEPDLVGVHEAGVAHHIAAVREIDREDRSAPVRHRARTVVVEIFVVVGADVAARENLFEVIEEFGVDRHHVFEVAVNGAILHHQDFAVARDDLRLDFADFLVAQNLDRQFAVDDLGCGSPERTSGRENRWCGASRVAASAFPTISGAAFQTISGVKDGFGLMELKVLNTCHAAPAATVTAFSAYLIGLCIRLKSPETAIPVV